MSNCIIAQSGGPTSVINASLGGCIEKALEIESINKIYGSTNGIVGILNDNIIDLTNIFKNNIEKLETLKTTPGMYLGSCRFKLEDPKKDNSQFKLIFKTFEKYQIKYFFYIGGNDSMDTVMKLSIYAKENNYEVKVIGIPKTIDNDLFGTDHTPGYGSCAKYIATTMLEVAHDTYIYDMESVTIVEIMGRHAGWLTSAAALSKNHYFDGPDLIYLPEIPFSKKQFLQDIVKIQKTKKNIIIAVSEGIKDKTGDFISSTSSTKDAFGHFPLSGTGKSLENLVKSSLKCKVRSIELNVLQRSAMHIASLTDINEAVLVGKKAVELAIMGKSGEMIVFNRISNNPYAIEISSIDISLVANKEKIVPREWINKEGNHINQELIDYMKPLIIGEPSLKFNNGLPLYVNINHLINN